MPKTLHSHRSTDSTIGIPMGVAVDVSNPLRSVAPTVDGDVLAVLARSHLALTGARVQQMAGRSYAQVREVLQRLVAHGIVDVERHGNAYSYMLNREHVLAAPIQAMIAADDDVETRMRATLELWELPPAAVAVFGSFARRDGDSESDIDLLLVRPDDVDESNETWATQRYELVRRIERVSGNVVQLVELSHAELHDAVMRGDQLIAALRDDGREIVGPKLRTLLSDEEVGTK
jgi:predicted nucleotidyltransferase